MIELVKIKIKEIKEEYARFKRLPLVEYLGVEKVNRKFLLFAAFMYTASVSLIVFNYIIS